MRCLSKISYLFSISPSLVKIRELCMHIRTHHSFIIWGHENKIYICLQTHAHTHTNQRRVITRKKQKKKEGNLSYAFWCNPRHKSLYIRGRAKGKKGLCIPGMNEGSTNNNKEKKKTFTGRREYSNEWLRTKTAPNSDMHYCFCNWLPNPTPPSPPHLLFPKPRA